jgi:hypothetical protein
MATRHYFLRSDVVVEPLISRWYAWSHMVSPATACLNIAYRYLPLMESFVSSPSAHVAACNDPKLRGGPFVDLPASSAEQIAELISTTKQELAGMIQFGSDLRSTLRLLMKNADGSSIEKYYEEAPESTKGYVELTYTLSGSPDIKVFETLLYAKNIHRPDTQTALLYQINDDSRPFAMSTPRLPSASALEIKQPFSSSVYDFLAKLRVEPKPLDEIARALSAPAENMELLRSLLTEQGAVRNIKQTRNATRWRYFGHACVLVESPSGVNVLLDPFVAYHREGDNNRFTLNDLPDHLDFVVLTHNHADHVSIETLLALRHKVSTVVVPSSGSSLADPSLKLMLDSIGFKNVISLDAFQNIAKNDLTLTALPFLGEHGDLDIRAKAAWLVTSNEETLLFAADSNNLEPKLYDHIKDTYGAVGTIFIGMECLGAPFSWSYGPYLPMAVDRKKDQSRRLNGSDFERGLKVITSLGCKNVYVYAMGAEPWMQFVTSIDPSEESIPAVNAKQLVDHCLSTGIHAKRLFGSHDSDLG